MKKYLLFAFVLLGLMPIPVCGQTFHAIIFANTKNSSIGESVEVDFNRMEVEMTTIAKSIGYNLKKSYYYGTSESFSRNSLEQMINGLSCSPDDIVFFYYSGHGGRAENENTIFPEMCLFVNDADLVSKSQLYPLHDVYSRIKAKNPRLTIVMGDLCNSVMEGFYRDDSKASKGATILSKGTCNVYKNLFLNAKGGIIVASSEPNYTSSCYVYQENGKWYTAGSYLTHSFLCVLKYFVDKGEDISWENLFDNTIALTKDYTKNKEHPQTPIYKSEISKVETHVNSNNINPTPQPPTPSNDEATNQKDNIAYALTTVCNQSINKLERIHNIPTAKNYFANAQVRVQVVGIDNKTIVNTCSVESYLNYLSMATKMDQVVVLNIQQNSTGKVTYMKVHEIHYQ
ncbi:MAG: caspase family protein [Prevotella sp.]|nr:caspase family protein [Prevotella sp.]